MVIIVKVLLSSTTISEKHLFITPYNAVTTGNTDYQNTHNSEQCVHTLHCLVALRPQADVVGNRELVRAQQAHGNALA